VDDETFTADELKYFKSMCEAAEKTGFDWPLAVATFPAETDREKRWKNKALKGILLCSTGKVKNHSLLTPDRFPQKPLKRQ
jgi:hypothetical protein